MKKKTKHQRKYPKKWSADRVRFENRKRDHISKKRDHISKKPNFKRKIDN